MSAIQQLLLGGGVVGSAIGQQEYTTPGTYQWVCPAGVTSISIVCVGAGAGGIRATSFGYARGGGGLGYRNNLAVTPGAQYNVVVGSGDNGDGGDSFFGSIGIVMGGGGKLNRPSSVPTNAIGGDFYGDGGGKGGNAKADNWSGGGGAGGYSGKGGDGAAGVAASGNPGNSGVGGGGGGGGGYVTSGGYIFTSGGGGVGIYGQGANGAGDPVANGGGGGSGGGSGAGAGDGTGGLFGGGGGANSGLNAPHSPGGRGAVRIIWPGNLRQFPSTRTANE